METELRESKGVLVSPRGASPLPASLPYLDSVFLGYPAVAMESAGVYLAGQTFSPDYGRLASGNWLLPGSSKHVTIFEVVKYHGAQTESRL